MRILFVTQFFDPEPTFKGLAFASELAALGHRVEVLTGFPNYPGGRIYPGYRLRLIRRERIDGIDVIRVPLYPSHSRSRLGRIANYCSFAMAAALIGVLAVRRPDVIYAYHPPATVGLPALLLKTVFGVPLVYDVQDLWPDTVAATGMVSSGLAMRMLSRLCSFVYTSADHVTVLSPGFKRALIERGVPEGRISVIYNWCDETQIGMRRTTSATRGSDRWRDKFLVVFAGTMGVAQALDTVLDTARLLTVRRPHVHFLFIGGGTEVERLKRKAAHQSLANVSFGDRVPFSEIGSVLDRADVLLVHLKNDPLFRITIPSKTQAYMAAGRPILMAVGGDAETLVREANCGVACEPENPESLADAIESLADMTVDDRTALGENGRRFYRASSSLEAGTRRFESLFRTMCAGGSVYQLHHE